MIVGVDGSRAFINQKTGTENYAYQILTHLAKIDTDNNYLVYIRPGQKIPKQLWPSNFKFKILNFKFMWTQAGLALQTFKDNLDVLFIPSHTLPLIRRPNLKTVITVHDLGAEYLPQTHQLKQRIYLKLMTNYQLQSATHIIAVSHSTKNDLVKLVGLPKDKISVIYEGYNDKLFKPIPYDTLNTILKYYNLEPKTYHLFLGTIQPRKNLERLIRAYAKFLKDPTFLVLVGSKGWLSDEIYQLPKKVGIEGHVKFLGYVPDEHLPALYSGAIAFLYPSLFEGFGLPILEAMACGCPVLTSNTSSCPEVAGKAALFVNPQSITNIASNIQQLSTNKQLQTSCTRLGFQQVKKFSWQKAAEETLKVLEKSANSC